MAPATPEHVLLSTSGMRPPWHDLVHPEIADKDVLAVHVPPGTYVREKPNNSKKDLGPVLHLLGDGALVLRKDIAEEAFEGVDGVELLPIDVHRKKEIVKGFVLVHVRRFALLDRSRARAVFIGGDDPCLSAIGALETVAFDRPAARVFRIVEAPRGVVVDHALATKLGKLTKKLVHPVGNAREVPVFLEGYSTQAPFEASDPRAAFDGLARADRAAALTHPLTALAVALDLDRGPRDDTREAASRHPTTAAQYAVLVDRGPHERTRAGAELEVTTAFQYATRIDFAISDALEERMIASGYWEPGQARGIRADLARNVPVGPAVRDLPAPIHAPRFDSEHPLAAELVADIDAMLLKGLELIGADADTAVADTIDKLHAYGDRLRYGEVRAVPRAWLMLGAVLGEQLHRAFGWSWGSIGGKVGLYSPNRAHATMPFFTVKRSIEKGADANTIALFFNMIAAGNLPPSKPGAASLVS